MYFNPKNGIDKNNLDLKTFICKIKYFMFLLYLLQSLAAAEVTKILNIFLVCYS